jgi:Ca-activated chloride channel family protein
MPLTADHEALRLLVNELDTAMFQTQGSELGMAIRSALKLLNARRSDAGQGVLILTDGEVHQPVDALAAAKEAAVAGVRVYSMVIGREAAPMPLADGSWLVDELGRTILSSPDSGVVTEIARLTGGAVAQSVASADDVRQLVALMKGDLRPGDRGIIQRRIAQSAFQWPLFAGIVLMTAAAWLGDGRRLWGAAAARAAGGAFFLLAPSMSAPAATRAEADDLYRAGRFEDAEAMFRELIVENPDEADLWGRLGATRYRLGDAEGAARAFEEQDRLAGGDADAAFNAGNAHYAARRWGEALRLYERALVLDPSHDGAARNKQLLEQEIVAFRKRAPSPPPPSGESERQQGEGSGSEGHVSADGEPEGSKPSEKTADPRAAEAPSGAPPGEGGRPSPGLGAEGTGALQGQESDSAQGAAEPPSATALGALAGEHGGSETAPSGAAAEPGALTAAQAQRLLEGIEEGRPRVVIPGDGSGGKPW